MDFELTAGNLSPLITIVGAAIIAYYAIPVIIKVSHFKHLFDDPSDERKLHTFDIPNLGGIAIFSAATVSFLLSGYATAEWVPYVTAGLILLFFSGIKDDILVISAPKKLAIQLMAIAAPIIGAQCVITDLGGMFGLYEIPYVAGFLLTFFTMVVVINAYNLIDGIDGLAGGIGAMVSLLLGGWFWSVGLLPEAMIAFALFGSLVAFLWYNFEPASIFMGDTGSQVIGYLLSFLAVRFVDFGVTSEIAIPFQNAIPVLILAIFIVPLYDTFRVFLIRTIHGRSPFSADRLHVHHQLIDIGFSHKTSCFIIYSYNIAIVGFTLILADYNVNLLFAGLLATAFILFPTFKFKRRVLRFFGIEVPSARYINTLERKYGITNKTIGHNPVSPSNGNDEVVPSSHNYNGDTDTHEVEEEKSKVFT